MFHDTDQPGVFVPPTMFMISWSSKTCPSLQTCQNGYDSGCV